MSLPGHSLVFQRDGAIASIVFNRPEAMNAIDASVTDGFVAACECIAEDPGVRVVVLSGTGRGFVAGGDLRLLCDAPDTVAPQLIDPMHRGLALLAAHPAVLLASVHGSAAGAGMSLVLACDLALAAQGTRFSMAYLRVGASCDLGASWTLPRVVGARKAAELALLNPVIDADEALRIGILNEVVAQDALEARTRALAEALAAMPQPALGKMVQLLRSAHGRSFEAQLQAERDAFHACATSAGFAERIGGLLAARNSRG